MCSDSRRPLGTVGLRINPLIGGGSIAALSTATATSKFGIPLNDESRPRILALVKRYPFIRAVMCHVGSQGMPVTLMARGVQVLCEFADEIDRLCADEGRRRIQMVDIGGGLSANYSADAVSPTFGDYMQAILDVYPGFHSQQRKIVTGKPFACLSIVWCTACCLYRIQLIPVFVWLVYRIW